MSEWKKLSQSKPKKQGPYLLLKMTEDGQDTFYEVDYWTKQDVYETRYSEEFKQNVRVLVESKGLGFKDNDYDFILEWMPIPGLNYYY